jgi:hypothetical protein
MNQACLAALRGMESLHETSCFAVFIDWFKMKNMLIYAKTVID